MITVQECFAPDFCPVVTNENSYNPQRKGGGEDELLQKAISEVASLGQDTPDIQREDGKLVRIPVVRSMLR